MLLLHGDTYLSRQAKTRRNGRGKRSGARIGRRCKNSSQKNEPRNEHKIPPAKWISPEAVPKDWAVLQPSPCPPILWPNNISILSYCPPMSNNI